MRKTAITLVTLALLATLILGVFAIMELDKQPEKRDSSFSLGVKELSYSGSGYVRSSSTYEYATVVNSYRSGSCNK